MVQFSNLPTDNEFTLQGSGGGTDSNPPASGLSPVFTLSSASSDVRTPTAGDGVTLASYIDPTIDAGIWNPLVDASVPTTTTTVPAPTTTVPAPAPTTTAPAPTTTVPAAT